MLRAELTHSVGPIEIDVDLGVGGGRCLALAGPSGAGKTTILRLLAGTLRPDRGRIASGDQVWVDTARGVWLAPERRRCGFVFQDYALFPHLSAWRNVAYGLRDVPRSERRQRATEVLDRFDLADRADAQVRELSGGERQRVAVARALAPNPSVLLLDEPLSALDVRTKAGAGRELAEAVRSLEVPVLLVTHDFHDAAMIGDDIAVIDRGRIVQRGAASELAATPATAFVADFAGAAVLTGTARPTAGGLTAVELDGGGTVMSTDTAVGRVAASVYPWEITIARPPGPPDESAQNRLPARVVAVTTVGNRARVSLRAGQPVAAEVTGRALEELGLAAGVEVVAIWKATATRLAPL